MEDRLPPPGPIRLDRTLPQFAQTGFRRDGARCGKPHPSELPSPQQKNDR